MSARPRRARIAATAALALSLAACASEKRERIEALLAPLRDLRAPGVAVLVRRDGQAPLFDAAGMADVDHGVPIGPDTAFDIASASKQFTGMLAILLHQDGRLDYDAPVVSFLPELARFGSAMTVRHLLTHTSGLPDYYDALARDVPPGGFVTNAQALAWLARQGQPDFPPGDRFAYSDAGYEMLALVLERAGGAPFGDLLRRRIFEPLGMSATLLRDRPDLPVPNRALGYAPRPDGFAAMADHPLDCLAGSGAVNTTLHDLALWDEALAAGRLVSTAALDEALRPARLNDGSEVPYAFGWFLKRDLWRRRWEHPGVWRGFQSLIVRYPDQKMSIVLLANRSDVDLGSFAEQILRIERLGF